MNGNGNPTKVRVGPGHLLIGPVGATEPDNLTTPWSSDWVRIGYTDEGHAFSMKPKFEGVEVAEEIDPILFRATSREMKVEFDMAEMTATNLSRAFNGGTVKTSEGIVVFEPPEPGEEVRVALGWEADDGLERWIFRKCLQTGEVEVARRKAPDKATIPTSFMLEKVAGKKPFKAIFGDEA